MPATDRLVAWIHDRPVAHLERDKRGRVWLNYTGDVFDSHQMNSPVLSCSLPLTTKRLDATAFIDGLLPEGDYRRWLAERARIVAHDTFGLVARYGRDIAGAVQFLPEGRDPVSDANWAVEPLDAEQMGGLVADLPTNPLAIVDESELSLPGMQAKMLLVAMPGGGWGRPLGGRPSTHILKRDSERHRGVVVAECEALALARHAGLTTVAAHVEHHSGYDCIIVERFDRIVNGAGEVMGRVHQEDACQALGLPPTQKYEIHHGGGGPEFSQIAGLLDRYAADPASELDRLAAVAAFTVIIGNADAHGKNVAFFIDPDGSIRLTPLYDTVPTVLWPALRKEAAMTLGGAVTFGGMNAGAVEREARRWKHSSHSAVASAAACAERLLDGVASGVVDPDGRLAAQVVGAAPRFLRPD